MCGETRTFHLCFGEGLSYNIRSAEDGLVQVSIQKLQVIFARAESSNCPRLNWQSCGFLPFPYSQQGYMNFNSWWAAYNSSSLGANNDGWSRISLWETDWPPTESITMNTSSLLPILYSVSFQDYCPHQTCPFTSLNLEVIWRRPTLRKENSTQKWRNWRYPIHPRASCHPDSTVCRPILSILPSLWQYSPVDCYSL